MAKIPEALHEPLNTAYPEFVCLVGTVQPGGWAQIGPRGSVVVLDDETVGYWDRGTGTTHDAVKDGSTVTVFFKSPEMKDAGVLPKGGIARLYGTATIHNEGPIREEIWTKMVQYERDSDPEKKGRAVTLKIERAEDLAHNPL